MSELTDFLAHHGVKGMKWGIRRYQNYDGTSIKKNGNKGEKPSYNSGTKKYEAKDARHLTDEELNRRLKRLTQENNYRDAVKRSKESDKTNRQKLINKIFVESATNAAATVMQTVYTKSATAFLNKNFPALMSTKTDNNNSGKKKKS